MVGLYKDVGNIVYEYCGFAGVLRETLHGHDGWITALTVLPNGDLCSASDDGDIKIWREYVCVSTINARSAVHSLAVLSNGDLCSSGSFDRTIAMWRESKCVQTLHGHSNAVYCLAVMPNGDLCSGSHDKTIKFGGTGFM